jgi:chromosome segregation ATPase
MGKVLDFEAARADLRGKIATNDAELGRTRERLGALALDVTLGNAAQSELDAATAQQARLQATAEALRGALDEVDKREAASEAAAAERRRQADEQRLAELQRVCNAAGAKVVDLATQLGAVLAQGQAAAQEADMLGRRLDVSTITIQAWPQNAHKVVSGRIGSGGGFLPGEQEAAEALLKGN